MLSKDISIMIGDEVLPRIDALEKGQALILERLDDIATELRIVRHDQMTLQTSVYWVLAAIGIFLGAIAIIPAFTSAANIFRKNNSEVKSSSEKPDSMSYPQVAELLARVLSKTSSQEQN